MNPLSLSLHRRNYKRNVKKSRFSISFFFLSHFKSTLTMSFNYSLIFDEQLSPDDPLFWSSPTPVNCNTIRILGIFLCIAALVGIVFNGALFYSFVRYKALRSPANIFVMFIAGMGLFASCTILPLTGSSSIYCQWLYQRKGCQFSAIIAFLYGCSSSYLLCGVSLSRCYIIIRPFKAKNITVSQENSFQRII
jgi:hypothetical protein